jgi:hypothetical protein
MLVLSAVCNSACVKLKWVKDEHKFSGLLVQPQGTTQGRSHVSANVRMLHICFFILPKKMHLRSQQKLSFGGSCKLALPWSTIILLWYVHYLCDKKYAYMAMFFGVWIHSFSYEIGHIYMSTDSQQMICIYYIARNVYFLAQKNVYFFERMQYRRRFWDEHANPTLLTCFHQAW